MNRRTIYRWTAMTALGLLTGVARADDSVVRVSDSPPAGASTPSAPMAPAPSAAPAPECGADGTQRVSGVVQ